MEFSLPLDSVAIRAILPHRYPFLLVDRVTELEPGQRGVGLKLVTANEPHFQGHFPAYPLMPGVLIVEALAQLAGVVVGVQDENAGKLGVFAGINNVRFKRQVVPGDVLTLEVEITGIKRGVCLADVKAAVDGELACRGELMFALVPDPMTAGS